MDGKPMRELFIEELVEVQGGQDPLDRFAIWKWLQEQLYNTTMACGEEPNSGC